MSCIAWDGEMLAADKQASVGGLARTTTKIKQIRNFLVGYAGEAVQGEEMVAWLSKGAKPNTFPEAQRDKDDWVAMLVIRPGVIIQIYERSPYPMVLEDKTMAIGSGRDFALTAMFLGKRADEAVRIACHFDKGCGLGVDVLRMRK